MINVCNCIGMSAIIEQSLVGAGLSSTEIVLLFVMYIFYIKVFAFTIFVLSATSASFEGVFLKERQLFKLYSIQKSIYNEISRESRQKNGKDPKLKRVPPNFQAPPEVNWVTSGAVTNVKNQGKCGSCYTFATVGALEGHLYLKYKKLLSLSPQQIVDCSGAYGNKGCNGGFTFNSFNYIKANGGINSDATYPYEAKQGTCRYNKKKIAGKCISYVHIPPGDEGALKNAVAMGPVAVSIDASLSSFMHYRSGVYSDPKCSSTNLGHAVLVVGYGTDTDTKKDYWLVKNSWGESWGDKGYIKMARNAKNMCGIATRPVYPNV